MIRRLIVRAIALESHVSGPLSKPPFPHGRCTLADLGCDLHACSHLCGCHGQQGGVSEKTIFTQRWIKYHYCKTYKHMHASTGITNVRGLGVQTPHLRRLCAESSPSQVGYLLLRLERVKTALFVVYNGCELAVQAEDKFTLFFFYKTWAWFI